MSGLSWKRPEFLGLALWLHAAVPLASQGLASTAPLEALAPVATNAPRTHSEMWLEVRVNGTTMARPAHMVKLNSGRLWVNIDDLLRWRIRPPVGEPLMLRGKEYRPLDAIDGLEYEVNEATQVLLIEGRAQVFTPTLINARGLDYSPPAPASRGAFLNYDLQYQQQQGAQRMDGLFELGLFNRLGFGTASFLGRRLPGDEQITRLETVWTHDEPLATRSLRIGDSIGRAGAWGRAVRFGGVQWGTDFTTRPDIISFPLPTFEGETALPSVIDLHVNNALRLSRHIAPGPFTITNVPVITGAGEVRVVVRDILGRESLISAPYYASSNLLQAGRHDYTYEAGFLRHRFAVESNDYGSLFIAGTHRLGLNDRLTGELRAELMVDQQTAGAAFSYNWTDIGLLSGATALSHGPAGGGGLLSLGLEHQGRRFGFTLYNQIASTDFTQLGASEHSLPPREVSLARANLSTGHRGSAFVGYTHQAGPTQPDIDLVSIGYSVNLFDDYFLSLFAVRSLHEEGATSFGLNLTHAFGSRTSASVNWTRQAGRSTPSFQLQRSLPQGDGVGYHLSSSGGPRNNQAAALLMQNGFGRYSAEIARQNDLSAQRFSASGGVALLGGGLHLSRRLDGSFAVVKVGDFPGVPVSADNQVVAHTDANGTALVPALRAYQENSISIRADALPLDAEIDSLRLTITPRRRSGSLLEFPVRKVRGALLKIILEDGSPLPSGAVVSIQGQEQTFPVARRGEAYVTGLERDNRVRATWKAQHCTLRVTLPADAGPLPVLGPLLCRGVTL